MTSPSMDFPMPVAVTWTAPASGRNLNAHRVQPREEIGGQPPSSLRWYLPAGGYSMMITNYLSSPINVAWMPGPDRDWINLFTCKPGESKTTTISATGWGYFLIAGDSDLSSADKGHATMTIAPFPQA